MKAINDFVDEHQVEITNFLIGIPKSNLFKNFKRFSIENFRERHH